MFRGFVGYDHIRKKILLRLKLFFFSGIFCKHFNQHFKLNAVLDLITEKIICKELTESCSIYNHVEFTSFFEIFSSTQKTCISFPSKHISKQINLLIIDAVLDLYKSKLKLELDNIYENKFIQQNTFLKQYFYRLMSKARQKSKISPIFSRGHDEKILLLLLLLCCNLYEYRKVGKMEKCLNV